MKSTMTTHYYLNLSRNYIKCHHVMAILRKCADLIFEFSKEVKNFKKRSKNLKI